MAIRPLRLVFTLFLAVIFFLPGFLPPAADSHFAKPLNLSSLTQNLIPNSSSASPVRHYTASQIQNYLQNARFKIDLPAFQIDDRLCRDAEKVYLIATSSAKLTNQDLDYFCPNCVKKAFLTIEGNYFIPGQDPWMASEQVGKLVSQDFSHLCVFQSQNQALLLFGKINNPSPAGQTQAPKTSSAAPLNFSESQLWQALVDYRHAHTKPDLQTVDSLCQYARERVAEHIKLYAEKPPEEYPNRDKYPLDAHAGFERDGASGYLFEKTGFNVVAENLAYWPSAASPNQVIEWGWDTSTEGHREAQLSDEYSHACLTGNQGFYVAIFAHN